MAKKESTYEEILSDIENKQYKPIYFLMGEEPYYIDKIADFILDNVVPEDAREFDQTVLYGKDVDICSVINYAKRYPIISEYQVIVVKEAQNIKSFDDLLYYAQKPQTATILVFCYKYGKVDMRKKFVSETAKTGIIYESKKLYESQIPAFVKSYLAKKGVSIEEKAVLMITEFLGSDLSRIVGELDKLLITKPAGQKTITPDLVETNIGISKEYNNFELTNALVKKDAMKAQQIAHYFARNSKDNPLVVTLTVLFNFFSNLMLYYYLPNKSEGIVASELKISPFFVKEYQLAARNYSGVKTMQIVGLIRTYDAKGKGIDNNSVSQGDLLKELISKILH
jgi:DNA polymerase-3 subunit delta